MSQRLFFLSFISSFSLYQTGPVLACGAYKAAHGLAFLLGSLGCSLFFYSAGNPEFLTSKKSSIGTLFAFLFAGVCTGWATMYYFLRLRRGQGTV